MDSLSGRVFTSGVVLLVLTGTFMAARVWARLLIIRTVGLDDGLILLSWLCSIAMIVAVNESARHGLGHHIDGVNYSDFVLYLKLQTTASSLYSIGICAAKASFAVLYLRLLPSLKYRILNYVLCAFLVCQALEEVLVVVFACRPVQKSWDPMMEGHCLDLRVLWWATFVFNLFTDLSLFLQPVRSMWKLQMPLAKRLGLIAMLSLGLLVTSISIIRINSVTRIGADVTYELAEPLIWSELELCALIICSCIPSLRQVAKKIPGLNSALGLSTAKSNPYYGNSGQQGASFHMQSRGRKDYKSTGTVSQKSKAAGRNHSRAYGTSSHVEALRHIGAQNESQDEIFPRKLANDGDVIMVTREVLRQESNIDAEGSQSASDVMSHNFDHLEAGDLHSLHRPLPSYHP